MTFYFTNQEVDQIMAEVESMDPHIADIYVNLVALNNFFEKVMPASYTHIDETLLHDAIEDIKCYLYAGHAKGEFANVCDTIQGRFNYIWVNGWNVPDDIAGADLLALDVIDL